MAAANPFDRQQNSKLNLIYKLLSWLETSSLHLYGKKRHEARVCNKFKQIF